MRKFVACLCVTVLMALVLIVPTHAFAQGIVPCEDADCSFADLVGLGQNIIDFLLRIAVPIAAALFAWAGFLYLTSAEKPGQRDTAKKIFQSVFWGLVIALGAWLIVSFLTTLFLDTDQFNTDPGSILPTG